MTYKRNNYTYRRVAKHVIKLCGRYYINMSPAQRRIHAKTDKEAIELSKPIIHQMLLERINLRLKRLQQRQAIHASNLEMSLRKQAGLSV